MNRLHLKAQCVSQALKFCLGCSFSLIHPSMLVLILSLLTNRHACMPLLLTWCYASTGTWSERLTLIPCACTAAVPLKSRVASVCLSFDTAFSSKPRKPGVGTTMTFGVVHKWVKAPKLSLPGPLTSKACNLWHYHLCPIIYHIIISACFFCAFSLCLQLKHFGASVHFFAAKTEPYASYLGF